MSSDPLDFSVIICAYTEERWNELRAAVASAQNQTHPPREIIVAVDHNPNLFKRVQQEIPGVICVENFSSSRGLSGTRNSGITLVKGAVVAFLDDDAVAAPNWLEKLREGYTQPEIRGVGGAILPQWPKEAPAWFPEEFLWVLGCTYRGMPTSDAPIRNLIGCNMSFRREVFQAIGGFRIGRVGTLSIGQENDETEFCIRLAHFWPETLLLYRPSAIVHHKVPVQRLRLSYFVRRCYSEGISKARLGKVVGRKASLFCEWTYTLKTLPLGIARNALQSLLRLELGGIGRAMMIVMGLIFTLAGYLSGGQQRPAEGVRCQELSDFGFLDFRFWIKGNSLQQSKIPNPKSKMVIPDTHHPIPNTRYPSPNTRLAVLMVTPRYFPYSGGVENHVHQVGRGLVRRGVEVTVLTTDFSGKLPTHEEIEGIQIRRVRSWPAKEDFYFAPEIYRMIRQGDGQPTGQPTNQPTDQPKWNLIHCQSYHTFVPILAMLAARQAKIPYLLTFHGGGHSSYLRHSMRSLQLKLLAPLLADAEKLVAVARFEIEYYRKLLGLPAEKFAYIPNGSDLAPLNLNQTPSPSKSSLITSVGRLERYKGHHRILAAMPQILEQRPEARLRIAGSGPFEPALQALAQKLGVAHRVEIQAVPPDDRMAMANLLADSALVTLFSEFETHPIAVMEALALKRPVLVADTSGLSELAQAGLVQSIPLKSSPSEIAVAVLKALAQPSIPKDVEERTWDMCAAELLLLYQQILGRPLCVS
ncbi:MAG: glycosyltransferase [Chloroflexi bacterium]|nr:glycosyltransferase [Chloroflexota bacterium]